ncbi:glycoside hydrolase family 3 N-terminal domain-containing protein [Brumimicrobium aurantiacum]|uniref:beta-N-acetylhexosaminidase n=1 Tax=Brumimicrobium aurantiacum TaxID=1737063 RepID=A0A3E1EYX9_9FLAO|nr:glycoside hydrolase family 3 N-terminal domain-containing protein [Brumimicrobium aurantiacum]RFC54764.1 beta-N-acetylglucosaminidase [Brumimicrobium aurantiacum]
MKILPVLALFVILSSGLISWSFYSTDDENPGSSNGLPAYMRLSPQWALEKLESLTLEEKIAQSFMVEVTPRKGENHLKIIDSLVDVHKIGGIITFQGTTDETKSTINRLQEKSTIPLLVGIDGEWGSNMRISDQPRYPFQLTMGAANQLESTRKIAQSIGSELNDLGIHLNFSPVVDLNTNPKNPVIGFRSFGENPSKVAGLTREMIQGMQDFSVLTCMKHFPGHGDTELDSHKDLPTVNKSKRELSMVDWLPYRQGRLVGASAVMMGHLNVPALDSSGLPSSLSATTIKDILRKELKFDGLVISDALNMQALTKHYGDVEIVKKAYLAGNDILLYPSKVKESIAIIKKAVENGEISEAEINEKTLRILRAKFYAIVYQNDQKPTLDAEEIEYAQTNIYEKALTVIKNDSAIPVREVLGRNLIINIGGDGSAFNKAAFRYTDADTLYAETAKDAWAIHKFQFKNYDNIYLNLIAPSVLPRNNFSYPEGWKELLREMPDNSNLYVSIFGNPYGIEDSYAFEKAKAVVLAYQNTKTGQDRAAQLIFGAFQAKTVLPITLSAEYQEGFGIETPEASRLKFTVPMELGVSRSQLSEIDSIVDKGIKAKAFPGCQVVVAKDGKVVYQKAFGHQTYDNKLAVDDNTIYDIASITKIVASTASLMYLQDQHEFSLDSTLGDFIGEVTRSTAYENINLRDMMTHQAGLVPWIPFYTSTLVNGRPDTMLYSNAPYANKTSIVANHLYMQDNYEDEILKVILSKPLRAKRYKYSDLGYYFVKKIVEKSSGEDLNDFVNNTFYAPMGLKTLGYHPLDKFELKQIAPTEQDTYYRHQLVHGYVHDMGAAMINGVGGHAGVFSSGTDLAGFMQMLLNGGEYGGRTYLSKSTIDEYTACQFCPKNRRGAGFDKPVYTGTGGPATEAASKSSFGHSGFTGTLTWADPEYNINYVFLSNRVYPSAENWKLVKMDIRTEIQRVIYEALK